MLTKIEAVAVIRAARAYPAGLDQNTWGLIRDVESEMADECLRQFRKSPGNVCL